MQMFDWNYNHNIMQESLDINLISLMRKSRNVINVIRKSRNVINVLFNQMIFLHIYTKWSSRVKTYYYDQLFNGLCTIVKVVKMMKLSKLKFKCYLRSFFVRHLWAYNDQLLHSKQTCISLVFNFVMLQVCN